MPAQYDHIGEKYEGVKELATAVPELLSVQDEVGDLAGCTILDLACGSGFYTREFAERDARRVVGVDISPEMIEAARHNSTTGEHKRVDYRVADCSEEPHFGQFDVVTGIWLLNYAADEHEMTQMFRCVQRNLAPTGKFVGITQNPFFSFEKPNSTKYGFTFELLEHVTHGRKVHVSAATTPEVEFDTYIADADVYHRSAQVAGLTAFEWVPLVIPDLPESNDKSCIDYWRDFRTNPCMALCVATR